MSGYSDRIDPAQKLENEQWRLRWLRRLRALRLFSAMTVEEAEESVRRLEQGTGSRSKDVSRGKPIPKEPTPAKAAGSTNSRPKATGRKSSKRRSSR
ncbi:hypothetical protein [Nitrolancea hollandica]|nr:hypothetical protein [Nitrolancea hollandica]